MATHKQKDATAPKKGFPNGVASAGGGLSYDMVRSKIVKGRDGYGAVITKAREDMLQEIKARKGLAEAKKVGENYNLVARHRKPGAHRNDAVGDETAYLGTRGANSRESNAYMKKIREGVKKRKSK